MNEGMWLLFSSQLPAAPSSPRVTLWRRLKAAGAIGLQNGLWVLPASSKHERVMDQFCAYVASHGGVAHCFVASSLGSATQAEILAQFLRERREEYEELVKHCQQFCAEIAGQQAAGRKTFAALEEHEAELSRLTRWQQAIAKRDYFGCDAAERARAAVQMCRLALSEFSQPVYAQLEIEAGGQA